jgi:hypothetical protein
MDTAEVSSLSQNSQGALAAMYTSQGNFYQENSTSADQDAPVNFPIAQSFSIRKESCIKFSRTTSLLAATGFSDDEEIPYP